jgi:multiple sugar transport system permease protein
VKRQRRQSILLHLAAGVVSVAILAPLAWSALASFSSQADLVARPVRWWPTEFTTERYSEILTGVGGVGETFRAALLNSTIVATATVAISIVVGVFGAYAFARLRFRLRKPTLVVFLISYMLPQVALLIPLYLILSTLGLLDNRLGLILVSCSLVVPFTLWILSNYFVTIPRDLEEAARVDGTTRIGALFRIILPAARPGIFAAIMFSFLLAWDEFMYALIFTSSDAAKTVPVAISEFAGRYTTDFGLVAAGGLIAAIPPVLIAVIFQRYVVSGMAAGAVKG